VRSIFAYLQNTQEMPAVHLARKNSQSSNEPLLFQFDILYSLETQGSIIYSNE